MRQTDSQDRTDDSLPNSRCGTSDVNQSTVGNSTPSNAHCRRLNGVSVPMRPTGDLAAAFTRRVVSHKMV